MNGKDVRELQAREDEIVRTLRRAGVHVDEVAEVDPYNAALAVKFALDDLDALLQFNIRLIDKFNTCRKKSERENLINELRAVTMNQLLERESISKCHFSYSKN